MGLAEVVLDSTPEVPEDGRVAEPGGGGRPCPDEVLVVVVQQEEGAKC